MSGDGMNPGEIRAARLAELKSNQQKLWSQFAAKMWIPEADFSGQVQQLLYEVDGDLQRLSPMGPEGQAAALDPEFGHVAWMQLADADVEKQKKAANYLDPGILKDIDDFFGSAISGIEKGVEKFGEGVKESARSIFSPILDPIDTASNVFALIGIVLLFLLLRRLAK